MFGLVVGWNLCGDRLIVMVSWSWNWENWIWRSGVVKVGFCEMISYIDLENVVDGDSFVIFFLWISINCLI